MTPEELHGIILQRKIYSGLSAEEAKKRLETFGLNQGVEPKKKSFWLRAWHIATEPMMLLLIITGFVYLILSDLVEAIVVWLSVLPIMAMEFFQEKKTDEAIAVLDKMAVKHAKVYRDGKLEDLEIKFVAPGDLIYVTAGDQIAADGYLLRSFGLSLDESVLTGESLSVVKSELPGEVEKIKDENRLHQGTLVVQGEGYMLVEFTGLLTKYGKLGNILQKIEKMDTPLQKKIHQLIRFVAMIAFGVAVVVGLIIGYFNSWSEGVLGALTMAMSLIPEEFPVVFSVFLIMGMWRLAKKNALVREMVMVETLGSATVICSDKTGTLTEGRMSLEKVYHNGKIFDVNDSGKTVIPSRPEASVSSTSGDESLNDLIKTSLLALEKVAVDPIEIEIQKFAKSINIDFDKFFADHDLKKDSSFDAKSKMVHHIWQNKNGECAQYSVGAPESILNSCKISKEDKDKAVAANETMAGVGYRVIGVARKVCACDAEISAEGMTFAGLLAMSDPPRKGVKEAIDLCQKAGVRVIMVTGDNKLTAHNIAESIGMDHNEEILSGSDLEKFSTEALNEAVKRHSIFARVQPEQKHAIVKALQGHGEIVAMTGDGVNDAPALRQADIGIAMGLRGTEVARAASGMVLMDDNFASIVSSVKEGRRIYDNMRSSFVFLLSFHLPIVGLAILPLIFSQNLIFLPIHIIFLEILCDPAAVLGFEQEKARRTLMDEPPRPANDPLINPLLWWKVIVQSLSIIAVCFAFYYYFGIYMGDLELGRTMTFASLIMSQLFLIILTREWSQVKSNRLLLIIPAIITALLFVIIYVPGIHDLFRMVSLNAAQYLMILGVSFAAMGFTSLVVRRKIK